MNDSKAAQIRRLKWTRC